MAIRLDIFTNADSLVFLLDVDLPPAKLLGKVPRLALHFGTSRRSFVAGLTFWNGTFTVFQAVEKVLVVVGVPIAAYWTFYTFSSTDSEKARLGYETKLARAKNFGIQIQINCRTAVVNGTQTVTGSVDIYNMGAVLVEIDVSGGNVISFYRLDYTPTGTPVPGITTNMPLLRSIASARFIQAFVPQRRRLLPFSFSPPRKGVYFVNFRGKVSFVNDDRTKTDPQLWGTATTVIVDGRNDNTCSTVPTV